MERPGNHSIAAYLYAMKMAWVLFHSSLRISDADGSSCSYCNTFLPFFLGLFELAPIYALYV